MLRPLLLACALFATVGETARADASVDGKSVTAGSCGAAGAGLYPTRDRKTPSGARWESGDRYLLSSSNANDRYTLIVRMEQKKPAGAGDQFLLCLPGRAIPTGSGGSDDTSWSFEFASLDRATADEIARVLHVTRKDRRPLGQGLRWRYRVGAEHPRAGDPLPVVLTVENQGPDTVVFTEGGGYRGSNRENRFRFRVFRDGAEQPDIGNPMNFGGLAGYVTLKPGEHRALREVDLKKWGAFDRPGTYEVQCAYDLDLAPSTNSTWATGNERWDLTADEKIRVEILPR